MLQSVIDRLMSRAGKALHQHSEWRHKFSRGTLMSVTQFRTSVINLYSFLIELKPRIANIQIYETVKITKMTSTLSEDIIFVIFTVYLIEKSLYFIGKHIRMWFISLSLSLSLFVLFSVCPRRFVRFVYDSLVAICREKDVLLKFRKS